MRRRTRRAPTPTAVGETSDPVFELTLHLGLCAAHDVRSCHHHEIQPASLRTGEPAKTLPEQPPGPIPGDRRADLAADREAQPVTLSSVGQGDHHEEAATQSPTLAEHPVELRSGSQSPVPSETPSHDPAGSCTVTPPAASGPSADAVSGSRGHPSSASGPGSHGCASASDCWAETSSSCRFLLSCWSRGGHHIRTNSRAYRKMAGPVKTSGVPLLVPPAVSMLVLRGYGQPTLQSPPMTSGPAFPQLLKSLCKRGFAGT
jgi:hypothetical protein